VANDFSVLFQPLTIGRGMPKLTLKNRMVMAPMVTCFADSQGEVTQRLVDYHVERAKGGVGTIVVEAMDVDDQMLFHRLGIFHDRFITELEYLATSIKENGAAAIGQINQTGLRGNLPGPDNLTKAKIAKLVEAFAKAADRVKRAGFDGVMIHGAHGYLISSFLSPLTNHRRDRYGGTREKRANLAVEVIQSVRSAVGEDFPIFFRMNGDDFLPGGITVEDALVTASLAEQAGADVISVAGGVGIMAHDLSLGDNKSYFQMIMPMYVPRGCRVELGAQIKKKIKIPLSIVGRINDPYLARDIIAGRKADLVDLGRQLLADPFFPKKIASGQISDILQCIACNYCHGKRMRAIKHVHCAINPEAGREAESKGIRHAVEPQKVMVIGGGVAGLEAAIWLAKRGHHVSLYEKSNRLGGQTLLAGLPPHKEEILTFPEFLTRQVKKLGVEIYLRHEVTPEFAIQQKPDVVIVATGGRQIQPSSIPIDPKITSIPAWKILSGGVDKFAQPVVVLGGGFVAAEITEYLCEKGLAEDITVVEMQQAIAFDMEPSFRQMLIEKLKNLGVKMIPHFMIKEVTATEVIGEDLQRKRPRKVKAETVMIALGTESVPFPVESIQNAGIKVFLIGDAKEPRGIAEAVRDGFFAGISV
jgi:2,4-dienoyl-CoA reductase-like NADH-dependent reductase (Old Yellow Enzyme family)/thioredoxin reductase